MAATPRDTSALQAALEQLRTGPSLTLSPGSPLCVAVIAVDRYLTPRPPSADDSDSFRYDVTVTDGRWRVKLQVARGVARAVRRGSLRCGVGLLMARLSLVHDETRLRHSFLRLDAIGGVTELAGPLACVGDVRGLVSWAPEQMSERPLDLSQTHYLPPWVNDDPHGSLWVPNSPAPEVVIDASRITLLAALEVFFQRGKQPRPLLLRILHRSRIKYFGKPEQNADFPFQVYYEVADQSGVMSMVLWNDLCPLWYNRLTVGSVLHVQNYVLKRSYQQRTRPRISHASLTALHSTEISLNPQSPAASLTVIPPQCVKPQWNLPDVPYSFTTRSEVENMNNNRFCDIIGLVTYVSRTERIKIKEQYGPDKLWAYRWVHAVDGTSESPFILKIFSSSQPEIFNSICPMTYLVCTQMRVCAEKSRSVYLTGSTETQLYITGCHKTQPYVNDPRIKRFIRWTQTLTRGPMMRRSVIGGHYTHPPAPPTFTPPTNSGTAEGLSFSTLLELRQELEELEYRERRRVCVQGHVAALHFHAWPPSPPQQEAVPGRERSPELRETSSDSDLSAGEVSPKRRRRHTDRVSHRYFTRSRKAPESQVGVTSRPAEAEQQRVDEGVDEEEERVTASAEETGTSRVSDHAASWESSTWLSAKQEVVDHFGCGRLHQRSVLERFDFKNEEASMHYLNLSPARWNPDVTSQTLTHTPVACSGYFSLTLLGLNHTAAVDLVFVPITSSEDPRAAGSSQDHHDNSLLSCLSTGHVHVQPDGARPSLESLMGSAPQLEGEQVVCVLSLCLLDEEQVEVVCTKLYRTSEIHQT